MSNFLSHEKMNPTIQDLIDKLELEVLNPGDPARQIERPNIYQIGYELTGFFSYSGEDLEQSVQVCGRKELMYMRTLSEQVLIALLTKYFSYRFPALVITWDDEAMERILVRLATIHNVTLLKSKKDTPVTIRELKFFLQKNFVEEMILPGYTFLEIYGIGVLITGYEDAKIGVAIELLDRGHRIITDDNVLIRRLAENYLEGCNRLDKSVEDSHFFLQNQKDGTKIDVTTQYGIKSTRAKKKIDLLIVLEEWNEKEFYDRLGLDEIYAEFLGERVPKIVLPVRKGRNLAVILEAAAMNSRLKIIGENSAEIFVAETKKIIEENKKMQGDKDMDKKRIGVLALKNQFGLKVITGEKALETTQVTTVSIHRPALALSGFFDIYEDPENICIQIFSNDEFRYLNGLPGERRNEILEKYLSYPFPMLVTTVDTEVPSWFLELVRKRGLILCKSPYKKVSQVIANFNGYLETAFNPTLSVHGVFLELYGFGVLIIGKSQIGKSETALELIHRGHRLVADDFVKFSRDTGGAVVGRAARLPYFMEVRGLGVIDIKALYGLGAVRLNKRLDFVIEMREQKTEDYLTSLHYESGAYEILNKNIPKIVLYMSSGRNAAAMVEIAVMNRMARALGHDPDKLYREGLKKLTDEERKLIEENPR